MDFDTMNRSENIFDLGRGSKKKSCNIVTTYVGGRTGDYTKFFFFHGPNSSKSAKKFFFVRGLGGG